MRKKVAALMVIVGSLFVAILIYSGWREVTQLEFLASADPAWMQMIDQFSESVSVVVLPDWIIYSVPDGLWMLAFSTFALLIWDFSLKGAGKYWYIVTYATGLLFEFTQILQSFPGTFDVADLSAMTAGCLLAGVLFMKRKEIWTRT